MQPSNLDITILCKVVDNFGDIGVVYRLARSLTDLFKGESLPLDSRVFEKNSVVSASERTTPSSGTTSVFPQRPFSSLSLRIIVDNLKSFSLLEPGINPDLDYQEINGWQIFQWDAEQLCFDKFSKEPPHVILECFQCGRPDWLEKLLFDVKIPNIADIIMIDYLTAEEYADTFHKLMSLTRSARVKKVNFMPGFTAKTGGLILDEPFMKALSKGAGKVLEKMQDYNGAGYTAKSHSSSSFEENVFNAIFFSYPADWQPAVRALQTFNKKIAGGKLNVFLAKGAGCQSFKSAYENVKCQPCEKSELFTLTELSFLPQTEWDQLLCRTPLLFIRGEDSLSRACLCGVPFVWHAYPQTEDYQLVKVQALLDAMRSHFATSVFMHVENCWQIYNGKEGNLEQAITDFLLHYNELREGFCNFSRSLINNGDLTLNLLEFIEERMS